MKAFDDLSDEDVLALTDEQIDYYIDRECAEQGVPLVPPTRPIAPDKAPVENDITVYSVEGITLSDMNEASELRAFVAQLKSRGEQSYLKPSYRHYFKPASDEVSIRPVAMLSESRAQSMKDAIAAHDIARKAYDTDSREYDKAIEGRDRIGRDIRERVERVHREDFERQQLRAEFDRYIELADGDRRMAWRFLARVKARAAELLPVLAEELGGPEAVFAPAEVVAVADDDGIQF